MIGVRKKAGEAPKKSKPVKRRGATPKAAGSGPSPRPRRSAPQSMPIPVQRKAPEKIRPATSTQQAKARAKAHKAKAPKVIRMPLRERILTRLSEVDLRPHAWIARVPFVVLVIGALGVGLAITLWLSTDAAERSYQLGAQRRTNEELLQRKEALERDVLRAESAPALADSARDLGMIPSRDIAHLVRDPQGNWLLVGAPKPAEGVAPAPLNSAIPDDADAVPKAGNSVEVPVQLPPVPPPVAVVPHMAPPAAVPPAPVADPPVGQQPVQQFAPAPAPDPAIAVLPPVADAPQASNIANSPVTGEQFSAVATTIPLPTA
ncbi:cell division protein FtsB [Mycobacteroides chelonae]|nr:cell division protein FtsB [Mycobacteroides chelonae]